MMMTHDIALVLREKVMSEYHWSLDDGHVYFLANMIGKDFMTGVLSKVSIDDKESQL